MSPSGKKPGSKVEESPSEKEVEPDLADLEREAAALLADAPEEDVDTRTIDFTCDFCGEMLHLDASLAGKRAPCPECRRIIKVPDLPKKKTSNWRERDRSLPSGAKREEVVLEGAWGSAQKRGPSQEALEEAGVLVDTGPDAPLYYRIRPHLAVGAVVLLLLAGGFTMWSYFSGSREEIALKQALAFTKDKGAERAGAAGLAALHQGVGTYHLRSAKPNSVELARTEYAQAVNLLSGGKGAERDALLAELALAQLDLGGTDEQVNTGARQPWNEVQRSVRTTLASIQSNEPRSEARLDAMRDVCRKLVALGQTSRVLTLTVTVYSTPGADQYEAIARAGLALLQAGKKEEAVKAADQALKPFDVKDKRPDLRPSVVALALALDRTPPAPVGTGLEEAENNAVGQAEGLARKGDWAKAREMGSGLSSDGRVRVLAAVAQVAVDNKAPEASADVAAAIDAAAKVNNRKNLSWVLLQLTDLAVRAKLPEDQQRAVAALVPDAGVRGWAQLVVVRGKLAGANRVVEPSALDGLEAGTAGAWVARQELARHNTRMDGNWEQNVKGWEETDKAFGMLGVAQGLQKAQ